MKSNNLLTQMKNQIVFTHPYFKECDVLKTFIKRIQLSPEGQRGCEHSNSKYARFKNKYSNRVVTDLISARARAGGNGQRTHLFDARKILLHCKQNDHRLAKKLDERSFNGSKVLKTVRSQAAKNYTSKLFL